MDAKFLKACRQYVMMGLPIIPLCTHDHSGMTVSHKEKCHQDGKKPLIRGWQTWSDTTMEHIKSWQSQFGDFNIGLPLGSNSGYVGVDIDGEAGEQLLLNMSMGDVPETWEYSTGAGRRLLYEIPVGMKTKKFKESGDGNHEECALLCEGQQTVLPPSIHRTGKVYTWHAERNPDNMDCCLAPQWLIKAIQQDTDEGKAKPLVLNLEDPDSVAMAFAAAKAELDLALPPETTPKTGTQKKKGKGPKATITEEELNSPIPEGQRDNQMTKIVGHFCAKYRNLGKEKILTLALDHNDKYCDPPLPPDVIQAKVENFWEAEQVKSASYKKRGGEGGGEEAEAFDPLALAQTILNVWEEEGICVKIQLATDVLWMCTTLTGPWRPYDSRETSFYSKITPIITNEQYGGKGGYATISKLRDISNALCIRLRELEWFWEADGKANINTQSLSCCKFIPLAHGKLLDWETGTIHPWDPDTNFTYALPLDYNPNEVCPNWEMRLKEWLPDESSRLIMQEFIGYSLIPYMGFEKALLLIGGGANGKSLFLETIQNMLGNQVTEAINMRMLFSNFGPQYLEGKILNICNEAAAEYLKGGFADEFKNMVSGGVVRADVKNKQAKYFANTAKFIFSANNDIKTTDKSEGWERRLTIVPFTQSFLDSDVTKYEIMSSFEGEYPGIFNWAIDGLRRLMKQKKFTVSNIVEDRKKKYLASNDITEDFFQNCLEYTRFRVIETGESESTDRRLAKGTPTATVAELFEMWVEYRESSVQKKKSKLKEYLADKKQIEMRRTKYFFDVGTKGATMCWIGLKIRVCDAEFLEFMQDNGSASLREYALRTLNDLDKMA